MPFVKLAITLIIFIIAFCTSSINGKEEEIIVRLFPTDKIQITASSFLNEDWRPSYGNDKKAETAWCAKKPHDTRGEWIQLNFEEPKEINHIEIIAGFARSMESFKNDARPKEITVTFSNGDRKDFILEDSINRQSLFVYSAPTKFVRLTIQSRYPGAKYIHTCISEIRVYSIE